MAETCGDQHPETSGERALTCTLPKGHDAHRSAKRAGMVWSYLNEGLAPLHAAIECVLLDHRNEIDGEMPDPNISELAYCFQQYTGWTVEQETRDD